MHLREARVRTIGIEEEPNRVLRLEGVRVQCIAVVVSRCLGEVKMAVIPPVSSGTCGYVCRCAEDDDVWFRDFRVDIPRALGMQSRQSCGH